VGKYLTLWLKNIFKSLEPLWFRDKKKFKTKRRALLRCLAKLPDKISFSINSSKACGA
jgi:hypothetical protein